MADEPSRPRRSQGPPPERRRGGTGRQGEAPALRGAWCRRGRASAGRAAVYRGRWAYRPPPDARPLPPAASRLAVRRRGGVVEEVRPVLAGLHSVEPPLPDEVARGGKVIDDDTKGSEARHHMNDGEAI